MATKNEVAKVEEKKKDEWVPKHGEKVLAVPRNGVKLRDYTRRVPGQAPQAIPEEGAIVEYDSYIHRKWIQGDLELRQLPKETPVTQS